MENIKKGKISVNTENIFPIIKKSLYSDHEIFLRELVSNAVDATQKIKTLASIGEFKGELGDIKVRVAFDEKAKTITITDSGIGMTADDIEKYINQIAFSGATEFLEKYEDKAKENQMIGHFGLGFYSAFMVADKVEINSLSFKENSESARWICTGSTDFEISKGDKESRGTEIILHISEDSKEFLDQFRLQGILDKYCKFLPVEVVFGTKKETIKEGEGDDAKDKEIEVENIINNTHPIWTKRPNELTDEDYLKFYDELYPFQEKPLFWIHLNVDHPFNLTGVLYFPKLKDKQFEVQKSKIQLFSNQVFITDSVDDIMPEFLRLLHGVVDSPDIPLNVSRSFLQSDSNVKKISSYITKKVADKLAEIFRKDRPQFEEKWEELEVFVKYGMLTEDKFYDKANKYNLYQNLDKKLFTWEEYKKHIEANQTDKVGNLVVLYTHDEATQGIYIEAAKKRHYDILTQNNVIDSHFVAFTESKLEKVSFKRIDSDTIDKLIPKDEKREALLNEEQSEKAKALLEKVAHNKEKYQVSAEALSPDDAPVILTKSEFMRRMKEQAALGGGGMGMFGMGNLPDTHQLVLNTCHPYVKKMISAKSPEKQELLTRQAFDLALLSQGMLQGKDLSSFIERSIELV